MSTVSEIGHKVYVVAHLSVRLNANFVGIGAVANYLTSLTERACCTWKREFSYLKANFLKAVELRLILFEFAGCKDNHTRLNPLLVVVLVEELIVFCLVHLGFYESVDKVCHRFGVRHKFCVLGVLPVVDIEEAFYSEVYEFLLSLVVARIRPAPQYDTCRHRVGNHVVSQNNLSALLVVGLNRDGGVGSVLNDTALHSNVTVVEVNVLVAVLHNQVFHSNLWSKGIVAVYVDKYAVSLKAGKVESFVLFEHSTRNLEVLKYYVVGLATI